MVAFTGYNRPDTYIISTASGAADSFSTSSSCNKTAKMKSPTTTIMVKTLAVASNSPTKVPTTANIIKATLGSPVHRFLSPKQSIGLSSSSSSSLNNTTATTTTTTIPSLQQQTNYSPSCPSSASPSSPSWTAFLGQNSGAYSDSDDSNYGPSLSPAPSDNSNCGEPKKRRRLTHLTPEEKILRRKLKNRVAAQTARDRKKAQMTDMEEMIANLQSENKKLQQYNNTLQKKAFNLATENAELRQRLGQLENGECSVSNSAGESAALVKTEPKSPRSAEPSVPQLKKQALALSHLIMQFTCFLSDLFSLLDEVCSTNSGARLDHCTSSSISTPKAAAECDSKEEEYVAVCPVQSSDQVVGSSPTELDSLNELIKSEHFYVKYPPSSAENGSNGEKVCRTEEEMQEPSSTVVPGEEAGIISAPLSLTDDYFSFEETDMSLLQTFMKECLSNNQEGTVSEELVEFSSLKNDKTSNFANTEEDKTASTPAPVARKRISEEKVPEPVSKLPKTGSVCDSGSESGIHSDYSNPNSPYQDQLLLQFNDMNPVDDILFPELFPCLI